MDSKENTLTSKEVKTELPESPLNNDDTLRNTDFALESRLSGDAVVKEEIELTYETCGGGSEIKTETSWLDSKVKIEIEESDLKEEWMSEIEETSENALLNSNVEDFENISVELPEEVFVKEEILEDPLLDVAEREFPEYYESTGENPSKSLQEEPILEEEKKELDCAAYGESLSCKSDVDSHMLIHSKGQIHTGNKSHKCDVCGRLFTQNRSLKRHMLIHTGDKPHICDVCGNAFNRKSILKKHLLTHSDEKPYKCDICGKSYCDLSHLKRHMFIHTGDKPHTCDTCGYAFTHKSALERHLLIHTGEKPYKCDICGKKFTQSGVLKSHMLTHTDEKPHKCDTCGKLFAHKSASKRHLLTHTGEKT